nr:putative E3 ubiquitin-protein ligase RING1a [Setaria viridis]
MASASCATSPRVGRRWPGCSAPRRASAAAGNAGSPSSSPEAVAPPSTTRSGCAPTPVPPLGHGTGHASACGRNRTGEKNEQIQASIAEAFRKQSEVIGRKSTAKATAAAFVRRSRRNIWAHGHSTYFRGRGRASSDAAALACSDDEEDGNGENGGKEESSAEESSQEKKNLRENFSTSPLRAWGKNGTRSQTRYRSFIGSNGRVLKGGRMIKLVECLRNSDDNDSERDIHLCLLPLDGQTTPNLEKPYLCCGPTLSIKQLCQFVATQTSHKDEEVEIYALKPSYSDLVSTNTSGFDKARLVGEERLSDLRSSFTFPNGVLELVYAIKVAN